MTRSDLELVEWCVTKALDLVNGRRTVRLSNGVYRIEVSRHDNDGWDYKVFIGAAETPLYSWVGPKTDSCIDVAQAELDFLSRSTVRLA